MFDFNTLPNAAYIADMMSRVASIDYDAALRRESWAVIYRLIPYKDGDKWCVLLGANLQEGIAGFGETPEEAIIDFEKAMQRRQP